MEEDVKTIADYLAIIRRRKWHIIISAVTLLLISVVVAVSLPSVYRSTATILIEEQEIPSELVRSTITSYADQRIQVISQRVMTRDNLGKIIDKYNLYADLRGRENREDLIISLRDSISLEMVSADVIDPRSGRPQQATIAFTLSFEDRSPEAVQRVANELTSLFLNENIKTRRQQAAETSSFFADEAQKLSQRISELETTLAIFKQENSGRLPELAQLNLQLMERTERELQETARRIQQLEDRKIYLQAELRQVEPSRPVIMSDGERVLSPSERLRALQSQYLSAQAVYSEEHPDLVKMRREISALKKEVGQTDDRQLIREQLSVKRAEYQKLLRKYSENHPDAIKLKRSISSLALRIVNAPETKFNRSYLDENADNPAYITLHAQLSAAEGELATIKQQRQQLREKLLDYEQRLMATPGVEKEYRALMRDYEGALAKYQDIRAKQMEAEVSQQLEKDQKAERFTLLEPPELPERPVKPNRMAILFLGFIFSIASGIGIAAIVESMDRSVWGSRGVTAILNEAPLGVIPYIENQADKIRHQRYVAVSLSLGVLSVVVAVIFTHFLWKPLDVLWFVMQRKIELFFI